MAMARIVRAADGQADSEKFIRAAAGFDDGVGRRGHPDLSKRRLAKKSRGDQEELAAPKIGQAGMPGRGRPGRCCNPREMNRKRAYQYARVSSLIFVR